MSKSNYDGYEFLVKEFEDMAAYVGALESELQSVYEEAPVDKYGELARASDEARIEELTGDIEIINDALGYLEECLTILENY